MMSISDIRSYDGIRELGRTGWKISEVSFGTWGNRRCLGDVDDKDIHCGVASLTDLGVNFFDTADVYGDGRSEQLLAQLRKEPLKEFYIATKAAQLNPHIASG